MNQTALLAPVLALALWTFTIFLVMAFGRLRSMDNPQDAAHTKDLKGEICGLSREEINMEKPCLAS